MRFHLSIIPDENQFIIFTVKNRIGIFFNLYNQFFGGKFTFASKHTVISGNPVRIGIAVLVNKNTIGLINKLKYNLYCLIIINYFAFRIITFFFI